MRESLALQEKGNQELLRLRNPIAGIRGIKKFVIVDYDSSSIYIYLKAEA